MRLSLRRFAGTANGDATTLDGLDSTAFLLAAGSRAGATDGLQAFEDGIVTGIVRPASDSATAVRVQNAAGTSDWVTINTTTGTVRLAAQPADNFDVITRGYSSARGMQLITNGSGLLGNNYNFSGLTFDAIETHGGGGSFSYTGSPNGPVKTSDEYAPVDIEKFYRLSVWGKSGNADGSGYDAANRQYVGIIEYDIDLNLNTTEYSRRYIGSVQTTLAAPLNTNDTTMTLTDATGWYNSTSAQNRHFLWWPYTSATGYTYPNYTYSRNFSRHIGSYSASGTWGNGGISGNTITLSAPWPGPDLPAGTPVQNGVGGASFKYIAANNLQFTQSWANYSGHIGGIDTAQIGDTNKFSYGTSFARVVFLPNLSGSTSNVVRFSDIWFSELSVRNLERFDSNADLTLQSYTTAGRPAAGTPGRVIWNSTTSRPNYDTGAAWILADGTAA